MTQDQADRFDRLNRLFDELVGLDPAARESEINARCTGDEELERELRALFAADVSGDPDNFLGGVVASEAEALGSAADVSGQVLGSWRIVRRHAEGGMGTVYVAERADGAYEALAAIKLVRGGILSPELDARLRAERQILAGLKHPGIAQLLDGGSTSDGTPYLVLEFIDGKPVTAWCDEHDLDLEERLRIFLKICASVAHAHGELVAHRDLKPSNILVTGDGEPKLLDFGIAKLLDAIDEGAAGATRSVSLMTPAYASPEQVAGQRAGVATDVYALGVLLYELLTGRLPLETRGLTPVALSRVVIQDVPPLPSTVVDGTARRRLAGDLDAVISRALRKEPGERYPSARALAHEVERFLGGLPVHARRDDWSYRTGKLLRRNAGLASTALVSLIALLSFSVSTFLQARALAAERDRAEAQRITAERVSGFLEEILTEADPNEAAGREVTAREILDRGAERVLADLESEPEIQATLATVMGRVYRNLGEYEAAEPLLDSGLVVRQRSRSGDPLALGQSLLERGALAYDVGDYGEAERLHREALAVFEGVIDGDDQLVADATDWIATSVAALGRMDEAEVLYRSNLEMNRRLHPEADADLAHAIINLADVLRDRGAYDEAISLGEEGLAQMRSVHGNVHLETAWALNQLASTLTRSGRNEDALPFVEEGLDVRGQIFPGPHAETAASLGNLAGILSSLGRVDESEAARRSSLAMLREIFPDDHPYIAGTTFSLGEMLFGAGRIDDALQVLEESVSLHRVAYPPGHPNLAFPLTSLGRAMLDADDPRSAQDYLLEAYNLRREGLPEGHWHVAASGLELGRALDRLGREDEAESYLREAFETLERELGVEDDRTGQARDALREHYLRRGMADRAAEVGSGSR